MKKNRELTRIHFYGFGYRMRLNGGRGRGDLRKSKGKMNKTENQNLPETFYSVKWSGRSTLSALPRDTYNKQFLKSRRADGNLHAFHFVE